MPLNKETKPNHLQSRIQLVKNHFLSNNPMTFYNYSFTPEFLVASNTTFSNKNKKHLEFQCKIPHLVENTD